MVQLVIGRVCSQTLDPANYTSCSAASGHVELGDLNAFLDWMANAGQSGGAPTGRRSSRSAPSSLRWTPPPRQRDLLQRRCVLEHAVLGGGERDAVRHRHRIGRRQHPLHGRRQRPHDHQPDVHRCLQRQRCLQLDDGEVPVMGLPGQRRVRPDAGHPGTDGRRRAEHDHLLQRRGLGSRRTSPRSRSSSPRGHGRLRCGRTYYTTDGSMPTTTSPCIRRLSLESPAPTRCGTSPPTAPATRRAPTPSGSGRPGQDRGVLTFDNGSVGQYTLGYLKALKPHGDTATFYVNSGIVRFRQIISWSQLG